MKKVRKLTNYNPLAFIAAHSKLGEKEVVDLALPFRLYSSLIIQGSYTELDHGACDAIIKGITEHLVKLQIMAADRQHRKLYDFTTILIKKWLAALELASSRKAFPELSTDTRKLLELAVHHYEVVLTQVDLGLILGTQARWTSLAKVFGCEEE